MHRSPGGPRGAARSPYSATPMPASRPSGFQPKVLASRAAGSGPSRTVALTPPTSSSPRSQVPQQATRLVDEHYRHLLARAANLSSFSSTLLEADGVTFLPIERFDRLIPSDGTADCGLRTAPRPTELSAGLTEKLNWKVEQLSIGNQIGTSPWQRAEPK